MRTTIPRQLLLSLVVSFLLLSSVAFSGEKKGLLIMLDGLRGDAAFSAPTPNLDALRNGTWADGYKGAWTFQACPNLDAAPSSATNHVAIATGVTATKSNVYSNGQIKRGRFNDYPTWLQRLRKGNPSIVTAWLHNWSEDGDIVAQATYQITCGEQFQGDIKIIEQAEQILEGTFPTTDGIKGTKWTAGNDIDAMMLYLDSLDMFGHAAGFTVNSDAYFEKVTFYDQKIGEILEIIKKRPHFAQEDWMIVVVADHGGINRTHGVVGCKNCYTIPLIVSGKSIPQGRMTGQPHNCDAAAYLLKHFTNEVPEVLDGKIEEVQPIAPLDVASGRLAQKDLPSLKGQPKENFSVALWFKANGAQVQDPVLISNKDWKNGKNPGFALAANTMTNGSCAWLNWGDGEARDDFHPLEYKTEQWTFMAVTADRNGNAVLFVGGQNGRLSFISGNVPLSKVKSFASSLDWNIGQDGTGNYPYKLNGEVKDVSVWLRALSIEEMNQIYHEKL